MLQPSANHMAICCAPLVHIGCLRAVHFMWGTGQGDVRMQYCRFCHDPVF